jgi:predicted  nucleic acid-binding Zn-ribbon protein
MPSTLLALALALAFSAPVCAQQVVTSKGVRTLTRTEGFKAEIEYRQAERVATDIALEVLQDIANAERARGSASGQATSITDQNKKANADYTTAKAAFDAMDQGYKSRLADFERQQAAFVQDVQNQHSQAAVLEALPSAQRDHNEVVRLNDWATKIGNTRTQLESQRTALLAEHDRVEAERVKLAKQKADAEGSLRGQRDTTVSQLGASKAQLKTGYDNLRVVVDYINRVRARQQALTGKPPGRSDILQQAEAKLKTRSTSGV